MQEGFKFGYQFESEGIVILVMLERCIVMWLEENLVYLCGSEAKELDHV